MKTFFALTLMTLMALPVWAESSSGGGGGAGSFGRFDYGKKAATKETKRWTLADWLEQKEKNHMMDLWLGMYAPSPYEFFLAGFYNSYHNDYTYGTATPNAILTRNSLSSYSGTLGAYATVVGLQGEYEHNSAEGFTHTAASLNVRVLGNAVQGTHLILYGGQRDLRIEATDTHLVQTFGGADLDLYLTRYFGLHGNYRKYMPYTEESLGATEGSRSEAGAFLDFGPARIQFQFFTEKQTSTKAGLVDETVRTGAQTALKFFF